MALTQQDYFKKPEESIDQYNQRIAGLSSANQPITSQSLQPVPTTNFVNPDYKPVSDVSRLDTTIPTTPAPVSPTTTPFDKQISDMIAQIQQGTTGLAGKPAFQTQQETIQGIPEQQKTQTDLSARLKAVQNEGLAIPLQLQQQAEGRGITVGGLQPLQTAALRTNAIQALGISSLLEASRGNLATAQDMVDRAVEAKFGPIKAERDAKIANLELILKSPDYTRAEQARAAAQLAIQKKAETAEKLVADDFEAAKKEALKYVGIADAVTLTEMQKAKSAVDVGLIAQRKGGLKTLEQQKTKAEILHLQAQAVKDLRESKGAGAGANAEDLLAYAQRLAADGKLPSPAELKLSGLTPGIVSQMAKTLPKPEGTVVDRNTGVRSTNLSGTQEDAVSAGYNLVNNVIPKLKEAFNDAYTGLLPGALSRIGIRSQAQQHYEDMRTQFLNQLLLANSGKVVSDKELARYQSLLPTLGAGAIGFTKDFSIFGRNGNTKLDDIGRSVENQLDSFTKIQGLSIYGYSKITIKVNGIDEQHNVGDIIEINGKRGRILADGSVAEIQ